MKRSILFAAAALLSAPSLAQAQESAPETQANTGAIGDIVVTANRRQETVQRSSLAIEVLTAEDIEKAGVTAPTQLSSIVSGLFVAQGGPAVQTFVRGVGSFATNSYAEAAIAYNVDGFYIARPTAVYGNFFDLQRIEVLKGPQGTLYGRNATGGAINLITNHPELGEYGGDLNVEVGNYDLVKTYGALNIPLGDRAALRGAFQLVDRDGYLSDGYDDEESESGRLHFYVEPNDDVSLLVTANYSHLGGQGPGSVRLPHTAGDEWTGGADSSGAGQPPPSCIFDPVAMALGCGQVRLLEQNGYLDNEVFALTADLEIDMGWATLSVLPGYRQMDADYLTYTPGFLFDMQETSEQSSLETRLSNESDFVKWVLGAYWYQERQTQLFYVDQGINQTGADTPELDTDSWAVFGEATWSLNDSLRLITGLRYTEEQRSQSGTASITAGPPSFSAVYPYITLPIASETSSSRTNYRVGLEYDLTDQNMLFATVSTGFKGGGVINALVTDTFPPEYITAYELGSRNRFFDNSVQLNLEAFLWEYENKQEGGIRFTPADGVAFLITPGDATLYGMDVDFTWHITPYDRINFGGEYLHAEYDSYSYDGLTGPARTTCELNPPGGGPPPVGVSCDGRPLPKAPEWSGNASYQHDFVLGSGAEITWDISAQFSSSYFLSNDYIPGGVDEEDGFVTADTTLTYTSPSGNFTIAGWVRNITDEAVYTGGIQEPFIDGVFYSTIAAPRTYGVRIGFDF